MNRRALIVVASLVASGCSMSLKTEALDPLKTGEGFCQTYFGEFLSKLASCESWTSAYRDYEYAGGLTMCGAIARSEQRGAVAYDAAAAQSCISAVEAAGCGDLEDAMERCETMFRGRVQAEGPCREELECADPDARCGSTDDSCPGRCLVPGRQGESCQDPYPSDCAAGFYCSNTFGRTCQPIVPIGQACPADSNGCVAGAYCEDFSTYTCQGYRGEYEWCNEWGPGYGQHAVCDPNRSLYCDTSAGASASYLWACKRGTPPSPPPPPLAENAPCSWSDRCVSPFTCVGDSADGTVAGICARARRAGEGCALGSYDCGAGAWCKRKPDGMGACEPWPDAVAEPCGLLEGERVRCLAGYCPTYSAPSACTPLRREGDWCGDFAGSWEGDDPCGGGDFARESCEQGPGGMYVCTTACMLQ